MESSMTKTANREPLTVRLDPESKKLFSAEAEKCGLEAGVAVGGRVDKALWAQAAGLQHGV